MKVKSLFLVIFLISCNVKTVGSIEKVVYAQNLEQVSSYNNIVSNFNNITDKMSLIINNYDNICGLEEQINFNEQATIDFVISSDDFNKFVDEIKFLDQDSESQQIKNLDSALQNLVLTLKPLYREYEKTILHYKDKDEDIPPIEYLHNSFLKKYGEFKTTYNEFTNLLWDEYEVSKKQDEYTLEQLNMTITSYMAKIVQAVDNGDVGNINKNINKLKNFSNSYIEKYFINEYQIKCFNEFRENAYEIQKDLKNKNLNNVDSYRDELVILYNKIIGSI